MSFTFANLPGVQVATVDGGLAAVNTPTTESIMVLGTSAIGPADSPFQVVSLAQAASLFGLNGTLIRGMSEVAAYCDNIYLFRIGTSQGVFTVGATSSGTETIGTAAFAWSNAAGTLYTYLVPNTLGTDVVPGAVLTTSGFTPSGFNLTSVAITGVSTQTVGATTYASITVAISPAAIIGTSESFSLTGNGSIVPGSPHSTATIQLTQVADQVINVGDAIVVAGATSSSLDGTSAVVSATLSGSIWTVTYLLGSAITLASTPQSAGTLVDSSTLNATVPGTGSVVVAANPGYTVQLGEVAATADTDYQVWYNEGILSLWLNGNLVYSNDSQFNVNTGDSVISGAAIGGLAVNNAVSGNPDTFANSVTLQVAASLVTVGVDLAPTFTAPVTGIGLNNRDLYVAQQNAMNLLQGFPIDICVVPGALSDAPNVAFYVSTNTATANNNPVTNPSAFEGGALDWLWTGTDSLGNPIYQFASEAFFRTSTNQKVVAPTLRGQGSPTTAVTFSFTSPTVRLASGVGSGGLIQPSGFHEVNFPYQLARFCFNQSEAPQADNGGCLGFIGCNGPASLSNFSLPAVKAWIGFLPVYATNGAGVQFTQVSGSGLLGIPFLVGASSDSLNPACADFANGFRIPGLFDSASGEYDGGPEIDANGFKVDIGAYIAVQGDYALISNGFGTYVGNIAGTVAGLVSSLDQLKAVTNKSIAGVSQLYRASLNQLDSLTFADIDMLRFVGTGALPVCLHDKTSATTASDYTLMLRQRIKFLMVQTLLTEANNYIGNGTNDGLTLTALKTALDADCLNLQKRGYISSYNFTITSTAAQQKIGQASIQVSFVPADELVQLNATIGINLNG